MYGIIVEGIRFMVESHFGLQIWQQCLEKAQVTNPDFSTHERYSERVVPNVLVALAEITGLTTDDVGILAGKYFVHFMCKYGYDKLLRVLGRRFSDFLKSMDNLHEYFRFSYPKIHPPSFHCEKEDGHGLVLHYRSRRDGYISYVMGQMIEIAKMFYKTDIEVQVVKKEQRRGVSYVVLRVNFDNPDHQSDSLLREQLRSLTEFIPVDSISVLSMFPFYICFNRNMQVVLAGKAISFIIPDIVGKRIDEQFELVRPFVKFNWDACKHHISNIFKLQTFKPVRKISNAFITFKLNDGVEDKIELQPQPVEAQPQQTNAPSPSVYTENEHRGQPEENDEEYSNTQLRLKGQMVYIKKSEWTMIPRVETLDQMFTIGLYINDYSISDCNRDIIMASVQQSDSLKELLKGEQEKSRRLIRNMKEISEARQKTKDLLAQMMPRSVALKLLRGQEPTSICQTFDEATVCFTKVYDFQSFSTRLPALAIINLLNNLYSTFDDVIERHGVYKVETIGESYMISCGIPIPTPHHCEYIADTALEMLHVMGNFIEETTGRRVLIKIGMHSGPVVGGVVGVKAPRYCLFGDTVNCASRMESHNTTPTTLMISIVSKELLEKGKPKAWHFKDRGTIEVKGKGKMQAYELSNKIGDARSDVDPLIDTNQDDIDSHADDQYSRMDEFESRLSGSISRMSVVKSMMSSSAGSSRAENETPTPTDDNYGELAKVPGVVHEPTRSSSDTAGLQVKSYVAQKEKEKAKDKHRDKEGTAVNHSVSSGLAIPEASIASEQTSTKKTKLGEKKGASIDKSSPAIVEQALSNGLVENHDERKQTTPTPTDNDNVELPKVPDANTEATRTSSNAADLKAKRNVVQKEKDKRHEQEATAVNGSVTPGAVTSGVSIASEKNSPNKMKLREKKGASIEDKKISSSPVIVEQALSNGKVENHDEQRTNVGSMPRTESLVSNGLTMEEALTPVDDLGKQNQCENGDETRVARPAKEEPLAQEDSHHVSPDPSKDNKNILIPRGASATRKLASNVAHTFDAHDPLHKAKSPTTASNIAVPHIPTVSVPEDKEKPGLQKLGRNGTRTKASVKIESSEISKAENGLILNAKLLMKGEQAAKPPKAYNNNKVIGNQSLSNGEGTLSHYHVSVENGGSVEKQCKCDISSRPKTSIHTDVDATSQ